jgi:endonuclease III
MPTISILDKDLPYDLPYAVAYGNLTWFVWRPLDDLHRCWVKITTGLKVKQDYPGTDLTITNSPLNKTRLMQELGLWFNPSTVLRKQPKIIRRLFLNHPVRLAWASREDIEICFIAAVLSPQISWETNGLWVRALHEHFRNKINEISNYEPNEINEIIKSRFPHARGMGYHAKVLVKTIQDVKDKLGSIHKIYKLDANDARKCLLDIYGIGPKISTFLVQTTHGDLTVPCVDRHVFENGINLGLISESAEAYFPSACRKFIDDCYKCPKKKKCAAGQLMRYPAPAWLATMLYCCSS